MIIRPAKKEDVDEIFELFLELCQEEDKSARKTAKFLRALREKRDDFERSGKKELLREIQDKNAAYLVAEIDGSIVGYCYASFSKTKDPFFKPAMIGYLSSIVVKKKLRGKGIAKKLHAKAMDWLKKKKCSTVYLEVFMNNNAMNVYENWGYKAATCKMWKKL